MTNQIIFNIDSDIKARAMKRAKREGVPFSVVLKLATKAFAEGQFSIGITDEILPQKMRLLERKSRLLDKGKGRRFASMGEFRSYMRGL